jgi:hypothetical protein
MSASNELHTRLNALRVANGLKARKHPISIEKMNAEIASYEPANDRTSWVANLARLHNVDPKVGRALIRRHIGPVTELKQNAKNEQIVADLFVASAQRRRAA